MTSSNCCLALVGVCLTAVVAGETVSNPLLDRLTREGVPVGAVTVPLPAPKLTGGDDREVREILAEVAGRHGWQRFVRQSIVSPFALQLNFVQDANGQRVGHTIDLWFVAYGNLDTLRDREWFEVFMGLDADDTTDSAEEIDDEMLQQSGIQVPADLVERFARMDFSLLNRIRVEGTGRIVDSSSDRTLVVAWELDGRFDDHPELGNVWRSIDADETGRRQLGPPHAYQGYGGYARITPLPEPSGALFVETHLVLHEPQAWFSGKNFLRSKLPLVMQETVRKFRRALRKMEQNRASGVEQVVDEPSHPK